MIPINCFFEGESIVIFAYEEDTIHELSEKILQAVPQRSHCRKTMHMFYKGKLLPKDETVAQVGFIPEETVEVTQEAIHGVPHGLHH